MDASPFMTKIDGYDNLYEIDVVAFRAHVYAAFPQLVGYVPASTCCRGCKAEDIANDLGRPAANAWESLYWYELLEDDVPS